MQRNPDLVGQITRTTGLSSDEIRKDFKNKVGPTLVLGNFSGESQDPKSQKINLDIRPFLALSKIDKIKNREEYEIHMFASVLYAIHEYGHYGDKKTNNGRNSGQEDKKSGDLDESSQLNGPQRKTAISGHRGIDLEHYILFGFIYPPGFGSERQNQKATAAIYGPDDSTVSEWMRQNIKESAKFKKFRNKIK